MPALPDQQQQLAPALRDSRIWELVYSLTFTGLYASAMGAVHPEPLTPEETAKVAAQARAAADTAVLLALESDSEPEPGPDPDPEP